MGRRGYRHDYITLPYFEDFEGHTAKTDNTLTHVNPNDWEIVHLYVTIDDDTKPQMYHKSEYAHSGNYSLLMRNRCIIALPPITEGIRLNTLKVGMYVRQAYEQYELDVGVWEDNNTFTTVGTINNLTSSVTFSEIDFSNYTGNGHRIALRNRNSNTESDVSLNYIDDIFIYQDPRYTY